jgi:hypothetical protein
MQVVEVQYRKGSGLKGARKGSLLGERKNGLVGNRGRNN